MAWYGQAKHRPMQVHSSKQWEQSVGGTRHEIRAIYGSSDYAKEDHSNDPLCKVVTHVNVAHQYGTTDPRNANNRDYYSDTMPAEPPSVEQILALARRAERMGMTIEQYVTLTGVTFTQGI